MRCQLLHARTVTAALPPETYIVIDFTQQSVLPTQTSSLWSQPSTSMSSYASPQDRSSSTALLFCSEPLQRSSDGGALMPCQHSEVNTS